MDNVKKPICPHCGRPMHVARIIPGIGGLPELRVYSCPQCGVSLTEAAQPGELAVGYERPRALQRSAIGRS